MILSKFCESMYYVVGTGTTTAATVLGLLLLLLARSLSVYHC